MAIWKEGKSPYSLQNRSQGGLCVGNYIFGINHRFDLNRKTWETISWGNQSPYQAGVIYNLYGIWDNRYVDAFNFSSLKSENIGSYLSASPNIPSEETWEEIGKTAIKTYRGKRNFPITFYYSNKLYIVGGEETTSKVYFEWEYDGWFWDWYYKREETVKGDIDTTRTISAYDVATKKPLITTIDYLKQSPQRMFR